MFAEVFLFSNFKASGCARKSMAFFIPHDNNVMISQKTNEFQIIIKP